MVVILANWALGGLNAQFAKSSDSDRFPAASPIINSRVDKIGADRSAPKKTG
jgi:hypothetical protein